MYEYLLGDLVPALFPLDVYKRQIQYNIAFVGVGPYQVLHQRHGLLCRVVERTFLVFLRHEDEDVYKRQGT